MSPAHAETAGTPPPVVLRLIQEAEEAKSQAQRLQREAAHKLDEARRICQAFGIDFVEVRQQRKDGVVGERQGQHQTPT